MAWSSSPWADPSSPLRGGGGPWAHESWPADEVLFNLRVPSPGPSRRERLFPERPDFPTGTKCGLFAGHESWRGAARPGLALPGGGPAISLRHIPPSPQLGLTAGSCGEPQDKGGKMGHVYSFTDQPGPGWPMGPSPWQWAALVLLVGSPVTTAPCDHTPNTGRASWRQKLAWSLYLIAGEPRGDALPEWRARDELQIGPHLTM